MDTKIADLGSCKKEVTVTIPAERVDQEINHAYESLKGQVALPGFRQGKVPLAMLEKRFGDGVAKDVASKVVESALGEVLREHKLEIVTEPELRSEMSGAERGKPLNFTVHIEVKPEFDPPTYKGLEVERVKKPVEDADVAKVVDDLRKSKGTFKASDGAFEKGDRVTGAVKAVLDGAVVWSADAMNVDGKTHEFGPYHVHGIEGVLEGRKAGDTVSLEGHGADHHDEGSHARPVTIDITIAEVAKVEPAPLDDSFVKQFNQESIDAFNADIRKRLEERRDGQADSEVDMKLVDLLVDASTFEMAQGPVDRALAQRRQQFTYELMMSGKPAQEAAAMLEEKIPEMRKGIEREARAWLIIERIAKKEKIFALEDDISREMEKVARDTGASMSEVRAYYEERGLLPQLRATVVERKVLNLLREHAKISDK